MGCLLAQENKLGHHSFLFTCNIYPQVNINNPQNVFKRGTLESNILKGRRKSVIIIKDA